MRKASARSYGALPSILMLRRAVSSSHVSIPISIEWDLCLKVSCLATPIRQTTLEFQKRGMVPQMHVQAQGSGNATTRSWKVAFFDIPLHYNASSDSSNSGDRAIRATYSRSFARTAPYPRSRRISFSRSATNVSSLSVRVWKLDRKNPLVSRFAGELGGLGTISDHRMAAGCLLSEV